MYLENYHKHYIYIRIDYYKKIKKHRLSWLDLRHYDNNFETIISYEYVPDDMSSYLREMIEKIDLNLYKDKTDIDDNYRVSINSDLFKKNIVFKRYILKNDEILFKVLEVVFDSLPGKLMCFYEELTASINGVTFKYDYRDEFTFDLYNEDINRLFEPDIKKNCQEIYDSGRVFFLEKIKDLYIAIVGGQSLYVVTIKYDEITKQIKIYCACPCPCICNHIGAVIFAIRNKKFRKFYKLIPKRENRSLLDRVMNFNFLLSIGTDDQGLHYIVIEDNQVKLFPVLNRDGETDWEVFEDDSQGSLTKRIKEIVSNQEKI